MYDDQVLAGLSGAYPFAYFYNDEFEIEIIIEKKVRFICFPLSI
ncbi:hypothetical protein GAGA_3119 [Paraglaciecola agarilytica NO2]|uniref:Uncharacterized protein n=1 Tax=Paraglaciecola agarilytica NO2 TaxID=1125747 RepID=A0ABQ0I9I8_9ALTE|nr:hypothetical protein GAGA_3119 [Paraglaciecola agarilytica NO2]